MKNQGRKEQDTIELNRVYLVMPAQNAVNTTSSVRAVDARKL
jgi:hypothetical protein